MLEIAQGKHPLQVEKLREQDQTIAKLRTQVEQVRDEIESMPPTTQEIIAA